MYCLLVMIVKRIYLGDFKRKVNLMAVFVANIISLIQNIVSTIIDFILILFSILSIICYYKNKYDRMSDSFLDTKFFL